LLFHPAVNRTNCIIGLPFYTIDTRMKPAVVADATLDYVAVVQEAPGSEQEDISVFALQWGLDSEHPDVRLRPFPRRGDTSGDISAAQYGREEVARGGVNGLKPVRTWPTRAGSIVAVGQENGEPRYWRLFANTAAAITQPGSAGLWTKLRPSGPQDACAEVFKVPAPAGQAPVLNHVFENELTCFELRGYPDGPPNSNNLIWVMTVYTPFQAPTLRRNDRPVGTLPLAEFSLGVFSRSQNQAPTLLVGEPGSQWEGWVAVEQPGKALMGSPWATFALATLGCEVLADDQAGVSATTDRASFTKAKLCSVNRGR
jgi:hypothetical protein